MKLIFVGEYHCWNAANEDGKLVHSFRPGDTVEAETDGNGNIADPLLAEAVEAGIAEVTNANS